MDMRIGVKTYEYFPALLSFKGKADFIEIMAVEGKDYSKFKELGMPIVVHCQHEGFGVNSADKTKVEKNTNAVNYAIELADKLDAKKIIVHPGKIVDENCSFENSVAFIKKFKDKRIIIENLPARKEELFLCSNLEQTKDYLRKSEKEHCFDLNHAIEGIPQSSFNEVINGFLKLKPQHFHIGGQKLNGANHLNFSDSEIDIKNMLNLFPSDAEITLETTIDPERLMKDVEFIRGLVNNRL